MIIKYIVLNEMAQVSLVEDEYVIQKISATASDPAFSNSILPGACWAYARGFQAAGRQEIGYLLTKLAITIENSVAVRTRFRKCCSQLLHYPGAGRVFGDIEMENLASCVFDYEKAVQHAKCQSRHGEEVHGRDELAVIAQESSPEFSGLVPRIQTPEIARNGAFGDIEAEFEKLTVNSRSAPGRILLYHPMDESSNLGLDLWPAEAPWARSQAPEQPKANPMPGDNGIWLNDDQGIAPCRPKTAKQNPK
jgi:hypothetical protein